MTKQNLPSNVNIGTVGGDNYGTVSIGDITIKIDKPPLSEETRQAKLTAYREWLLAETRFINLRGIPLPRGVKQVPLDKVYIELQAVEEKEDPHEFERLKQAEKDDKSFEPFQGKQGLLTMLRTLGERLYLQGETYRKMERPAPVNPMAALQQHERLVILGAPGAGKSTMLRYLARRVVEQDDERLPILLSLREYVTNPRWKHLVEFALSKAAAGDEELEQVLVEKIQAGQVLWLLDGLDEAHRLNKEVLTEANQLPGQLMITSRPIGYVHGLEALPHFEVLPLTPDNVNQFLVDWFGILAVNYGHEEPTWVEQRQNHLQNQLAERRQLQSLTRNPLLLTFLVALVGENPQVELPHNRVGLYQQYLEKLIAWETEKQTEFRLAHFEGTMAHLMAQRGFHYLGWRLHLAYYGGKSEAIPNQTTLRHDLSRYLHQLPDVATPLQAEALGQEILAFWQTAGLIDRWDMPLPDGRREQFLAFRHLTFQEFATANALAEAWQRDSKQAWQFLIPRLHVQTWREPLLMVAKLLPTNEAEDLIKRLLKGVSPYERELQRDFRLAVLMWGEGVELSEYVGQQIHKRLLKHLRDHSGKRMAVLAIIYIVGMLLTLFATCFAPLLMCVWTVVWVLGWMGWWRIWKLITLPNRYLWPYKPRSPFVLNVKQVTPVLITALCERSKYEIGLSFFVKIPFVQNIISYMPSIVFGLFGLFLADTPVFCGKS